MAGDTLHESKEDISKDTCDLHRAIASLTEELDAVDWYRQRADACRDDHLRSILLHNMREEIEHSVMLIEWLRRNSRDFGANMKNYLFSDNPITDVAQNAGKSDCGVTSSMITIGSLKE